MRYYYLILILFWTSIFGTNGQAQSVTLESLSIAECLRIAQEKEANGDKKEATRFLNQAGNIEWENKNYPQAILHFEKSIRLNNDIGNDNGITMLNNNLGMIYADMHEYEKSLNYFQKTLASRRNMGEKGSIISSLINISVVMNNLKRYSESAVQLEEALTLARELNSPDLMRSCYGMLSETYEKAGNSNESRRYFDLYRTFHEKTQKDKEREFKTLAEKAQLEAELIAEKKHIADLELEVKNQKLKEKEVELFESDRSIQNLMSNVSKKEMAIRLLSREAEARKKDAQIKDLKIKEEQAKNQINRLVRNALIAGLALVGVIAFIIFRQYRQKQKINQQLAAQNEEIAAQRDNLKMLNEEINQQKEEILAQRDNLAELNEQLGQANAEVSWINKALEREKNVVTHQNRALEKNNQVLLKLVKSPQIQNGHWEKALINLIETVATQLNISYVSVWQFIPHDESRMICIKCYNAETQKYEARDIIEEASHPQYFAAIRNGETLIADSLKKSNHFVEFGEAYFEEKNLKSRLDMPFFIQGVAGGAISCEVSEKKREWSLLDENFLKSINDIVLIAYKSYQRRQAEIQIKRQKEQIEQEREKSDKLLLNILPEATALELKEKGEATPQSYEMVTVLFTDFSGFTQIAAKLQPVEVIQELDYCFAAFDEIIEKYNLEKIKTIGDAYMCAGGIPLSNQTNPLDAVRAGLEIQAFMEKFKQEKLQKGEATWEARVGIHTGPLVAGVVGKKKFAYDIWGDAVNTASRMESSGEPGKVNISGATYELIKNQFECTYRGKVYAKNKGDVDMYFVESELSKPAQAPLIAQASAMSISNA
ncbi:MAG: tetratricopeptide repeat protein [Microscillaceae bacterium]|jgi:class 3 adenylate cyclase|nr:tetratricopeptide repeat protein [Microscillaceae bacterium]